jgi:hypothetical protein
MTGGGPEDINFSQLLMTLARWGFDDAQVAVGDGDNLSIESDFSTSKLRTWVKHF